MVLALWVEHRTYPYHGHVLPLYYVSIFWWGQRESNPYDISRRSLSSARLPIPSCPLFGDSGRSRTDDQGVAVLRLTTWLRNHFGRDSWGRTSASGSQSPLPYHLATSLFLVGRAGFEPAYSMRADLQSAAFTRLRYLPIFLMTVIRSSTPSSQRQRDIFTFGQYNHLN